MRKFRVIILLILIICGGCRKAFDPVVIQTVNVIEQNSNVDPLTLIKDADDAGLVFEVKENTINTAIPGDYYVVYTITSKNGKDSVERRYDFAVADDDAPVLLVDDTITIRQGQNFTIFDHAKAVDERDGDVSDKITYSGSINTYKEGSYTINVTASDRFGNTASKDVTVVVTAVTNEQLADNIVGSYTDVSYTGGQSPTVTLNDDGTFILYINGCTVFSAVEGEYIVHEGYVYLSSSTQPFSSVIEENVVSFTIQPDGNLLFHSEMKSCAPNYGDLFTKNQ